MGPPGEHKHSPPSGGGEREPAGTWSPLRSWSLWAAAGGVALAWATAIGGRRVPTLGEPGETLAFVIDTALRAAFYGLLLGAIGFGVAKLIYRDRPRPTRPFPTSNQQFVTAAAFTLLAAAPLFLFEGQASQATAATQPVDPAVAACAEFLNVPEGEPAESDPQRWFDDLATHAGEVFRHAAQSDRPRLASEARAYAATAQELAAYFRAGDRTSTELAMGRLSLTMTELENICGDLPTP
jgi:hypothetical protein